MFFPRDLRYVAIVSLTALHVGAFYALQSGLAREVTERVKQTVVARLIAPEPQPQVVVPPPSVPSPPQQKLKLPAAVLPSAGKPSPPSALPVPVAAPPTATSTTSIALPPAPAEAPKTEPAAAIVAAPAPAPAPSTNTGIAPPPAQAATTAPVPAVKTITTGVQYLQQPEPVYPAISRRMGEQGRVVLRILVNPQGAPERVELQRSSGFPKLDSAAREAARGARFKPFTEDGKPVAVWAVVPIVFELDQESPS
jgi:periplasmic protein TonB